MQMETSLVHNILSIFRQILFINSTPAFLNRRPAARYPDLTSINIGPREVLLEFVILVF